MEVHGDCQSCKENAVSGRSIQKYSWECWKGWGPGGSQADFKIWDNYFTSKSKQNRLLCVWWDQIEMNFHRSSCSYWICIWVIMSSYAFTWTDIVEGWSFGIRNLDVGLDFLIGNFFLMPSSKTGTVSCLSIDAKFSFLLIAGQYCV